MSLITIYLFFSMLATVWFDVRRFIIPNWLVASLLVLYPLAVWLAPQAVDWPMALAGTGIVFAVGYGVFAMKWMGAGDIKLLVVCSLWAGWNYLLEFIFLVAILGGLFSVVLWLGRKVLVHVPNLPQPLPRILREGEPVPYGVAIAVGFLWAMWAGNIPVMMP